MACEVALHFLQEKGSAAQPNAEDIPAVQAAATMLVAFGAMAGILAYRAFASIGEGRFRGTSHGEMVNLH